MAKLTREQWRELFEIRCRAKCGDHVSAEELALCEAAMADDAERYAAMGRDVFNATVPFGSTVLK